MNKFVLFWLGLIFLKNSQAIEARLSGVQISGSNKEAKGFAGFLMSAAKALAMICKETGAEIVLSSTWRLWEGNTGIDAVDKVPFRLEQPCLSFFDGFRVFFCPSVHLFRGLLGSLSLSLSPKLKSLATNTSCQTPNIS